MLTIKSKLFVASLIGAIAMPMAAQAASKTATFDVSMKIVADCTISAAALDFGQNRGLLTSTVSANSNLTVTCTNTTPYTVGLDAGTGTGSSGTSRYMNGTNGNTATVPFNLYRTQGAGLWGNTQGTDTMSGTGTGAAQTLTVYGEVPAQAQTPAPDTYKSTVTATIYF
jgi:spore coat protein U-like protein